MKSKPSYVEELKSILLNKTFLICVILTAVIAYGFAAFNVTVSIDDLEGDRYVGSGMDMLQAGRFTMTFLSVLFGYGGRVLENAYLIDIFAIIGLLWSAVNFCILFRRVCGQAISNASCLVFSCVFVSYPLHLEIWEYTGANLCVSFGFLCVSAAALSMYRVLHTNTGHQWKTILAACLLLMLVCAGYESLVPVYIFTVFAVLALQVIYGSEKEKKLLEILRQGICYAAVLAVGLVLRLVVHQILLRILGIEAASNGATFIIWGTRPVVGIAITLLLRWLKEYLLQAIIYFPLTELVISAVLLLLIGLSECRKHGWTLLLPGVGMYLTLVILALLQGVISPYRTCQVFAIFVAFTAMLLFITVEKWKKPKLRSTLLILCGILCIHQANYINYYLTLNHIRSEEEAFVVRSIAKDLEAISDQEKPVIFVGEYQLSDYIAEAASIPETSLRWRVYKKASRYCESINWDAFNPDSMSRKLPQTNVQSVLSWAVTGLRQENMLHLFSYYGYDYILPDYYSVYPEAVTYAQSTNMPAYPKDGYIQDTGRFIVVNLG